MPSTQDLLSAITNLQQNAQASLPVIPNNGNPRGANNMPKPITPQQGQVPAASIYPWMKPSPSVDIIKQLLSQPLSQPTPQPVAQTPIPVIPNRLVY